MERYRVPWDFMVRALDLDLKNQRQFLRGGNFQAEPRKTESWSKPVQDGRESVLGRGSGMS